MELDKPWAWADDKKNRRQFEVYRQSDVGSFVKLLDHNGGLLVSVVNSQLMFLITYICITELEMEILT